MQRGFEDESVEFLRRKCHVGDIGIIHVFSVPQSPGTIYVIARSPQHIRRAFERVHTVYTSDRDIILVSQADNNLLFGLNSPLPVKEGDWVRVKVKGLYKDDIGYVLNADVPNSSAMVLLFPRLSYVKGLKNDRKNGLITRPPPALFDHNRARVVFGQISVRGNDATQSYTFRKMSFQDGFLKRVFPFRQLVMKDVHPTYKEIEGFCPYLMKTTPSWDWSRSRWYRDDYLKGLCIGDRVRVVQGQEMGRVGYVVDVKEYGVVEVQYSTELNTNLDTDVRVELPAHHTVRAFRVGDYIRVRHGIHTGIRGDIVEIDKNTLRVIATLSDNPELNRDMVRLAEFQFLPVLTQLVADAGQDRTPYSPSH